MDDIQLDDLVDLYISGQLSESQRLAFEEKLLADETLRDKVDQRKLTRRALREVYNAELKGRIKKHDQKARLRWVYRLVATMLLLGTGALTYFKFSSSTQDVDLSAFDPYEEGIPNYMGIEGDRSFQEAMSAFRKEDYELASSLFSNMQVSDTVAYFEGVSRYRMGEFEEALRCLSKVSDESVYAEKADFRTALILLQLGKHSEANLEMQAILSDSTHLFFYETNQLKFHVEQRENK